jgi:ABC-type Fe3+-hydroxamate transport system substrate-binding protein
MNDHQFQWNRQSPVDYVPQRVISLVPSMTESLFDLDLGSRVIGVTDNCTRPEEKVHALPKVGGTKNPDIARIILMKPDLVLMNDEENRKADSEALKAAGVPIWVTGPRTVFEALNLLWDMMGVFDHGVMSVRVHEIERAYDYTQAASKVHQPVRVFAPTGRDPWVTFNADTYAHDLLRICGGQNVFAEHQPLTLDEVVAVEPEVILLPDEPYAFSESDAQELYRLNIPAAENGQIYIMDGTLLTWHGTRLAYALRDLPPLLLRQDAES